MSTNVEFELKRSEAGIPMTVTLTEADDAPIDLSNGWTVDLKVTRRSSTDAVISGAMTPDADQTLEGNRGQATFVFTAEHSANPKGSYDMEITATGPGGTPVRKFPKKGDAVLYGTLKILASKSA